MGGGIFMRLRRRIFRDDKALVLDHDCAVSGCSATGMSISKVVICFSLARLSLASPPEGTQRSTQSTKLQLRRTYTSIT